MEAKRSARGVDLQTLELDVVNGCCQSGYEAKAVTGKLGGIAWNYLLFSEILDNLAYETDMQ